MSLVEKYGSLFNSFSGKKVLVVGDLMLDTYLIGKASRISPEAPVPVVKLDHREDRLGGAANCAMNIAALGGVPIMMGAVGRQEPGERFLEIVHQHDFPDQGILVHDYFTTTRKVRVVAESQQIVRVDEEVKFEMTDMNFKRSVSFLEKTIPEVGAIAISDYAKGFVTGELMTEINNLAKIRTIPILVDPKPVNASLFKGVELLKPNRKEAGELSGIDITDDKSCDLAAEKIIGEYSPKALLITRGSHGMHLYNEDASPVRMLVNVSYVYDVSGAGDTVLATIALARAAGVEIADACEVAAYAASVAVRKPGTSTVTPDEILDALKSHG